MTTTCTYTFDPADHDGASSLTEEWSCPHDSHADNDLCQFHIPPSEYGEHEITPAEVTDALVHKLKNDSNTDKQFIGVEFQELVFDYIDIESEDQHPIDFRHATVHDRLSAADGRFEEQLDIRHTTIGELNLDNITLEEGILGNGSTITGPVTLFEALITGDNTNFSDATFTDEVCINEADFNNDVSFEDTGDVPREPVIAAAMVIDAIEGN
jgi:uncharacterized protein YjbI with pentapeptide repeats